jgi:hypothetical protein
LGDCLLRAVFFKCPKYPQYLGYFFHCKSHASVLTKDGLGYIWATFWGYILGLHFLGYILSYIFGLHFWRCILKPHRVTLIPRSVHLSSIL